MASKTVVLITTPDARAAAEKALGEGWQGALVPQCTGATPVRQGTVVRYVLCASLTDKEAAHVASVASLLAASVTTKEASGLPREVLAEARTEHERKPAVQVEAEATKVADGEVLATR